MENAVAEGALRLLEAVDYARLPEKNLHVPQLDKLTKKICQLRAKGFEFHHISSLLLTGGVDLHPDTIRDFFYAAHETRMTAYELLIT